MQDRPMGSVRVPSSLFFAIAPFMQIELQCTCWSGILHITKHTHTHTHLRSQSTHVNALFFHVRQANFALTLIFVHRRSIKFLSLCCLFLLSVSQVLHSIFLFFVLFPLSFMHRIHGKKHRCAHEQRPPMHVVKNRNRQTPKPISQVRCCSPSLSTVHLPMMIDFFLQLVHNDAEIAFVACTHRSCVSVRMHSSSSNADDVVS